LRLCKSCRRNRLAGYTPGAICGPRQQALSDRQHFASLDARGDLATWVWETEPMRSALASLNFRAVLVIYRSAARLSGHELGKRTGLSESTIWYWEAGERDGLCEIRQLLQFADSVKFPRAALLRCSSASRTPSATSRPDWQQRRRREARTVAERQGTALPAATMTGATARALAARLAQHGYRVTFLYDRDPAVFKLTGLPGDPDVEVTAEDSGPAACHYTGSSLAEAAAVIARLPAPGHSQHEAAPTDTMIAAVDGIEIEWHYLTSPGPPADVGQVAAALLAHLPVLAGWSGGRDAAPAGARGAGHG
jgi:transcriptional regulator with XRE-family HTH domain